MWNVRITARLSRLIGALSSIEHHDCLRKRLIHAAFGSASVQASSGILALGVGIMLARNLGPEGYGIYAYAFALMSILVIFAEAGAPILLMREVAAANSRNDLATLRGAIQRAAQSVIFVSMLLSATGMFVVWQSYQKINFVTSQTLAVMLFLLPAAALAKTLAHGLRGLGRIVLGQFIELVLRPILFLLLIGPLFLLNPKLHTPPIAMGGQLVAVLLILVLAFYLLRKSMPANAREVPPTFGAWDWLKSAFPFTLIGGAIVINSQADVVMLGWFTTANEVGTYRVATQVSSMLFFPLQVLQATLAPQFARLYAARSWHTLRSLDKQSRYLGLLATTPLFLLIFPFSGHIVDFGFGENFSRAINPIAILAIGLFANVACGAAGTLMQMAKKEKIVFRVLFVTSTINVAANFVLIPIFGMTGAAISTALTTFAYQLLLRFYVNSLLYIQNAGDQDGNET